MPTWQDSRIREASGLAMSQASPGDLWVHGDEDGKCFLVEASTGRRVGACALDGFTLQDPEALSEDLQGRLWVFDGGDGHPDEGDPATRDHIAVYVAQDPGRGNHGPIRFTRYVLKYPGGDKFNSEALLTHAAVEDRFVITKETTGKVFRLPADLQAHGHINKLQLVTSSAALNLVADATFQIDGRFVFAVLKGDVDTIHVINPSDWSEVDTFSMDPMTKPEGIATAADGLSLWVCDDDMSPGGSYQNVPIPSAYQPTAASTAQPNLNVSDDAGGLPPTPGPTPDNPCG